MGETCGSAIIFTKRDLKQVIENKVVVSARAACTVKNLEIKNNHAPWQNVAPAQKKGEGEVEKGGGTALCQTDVAGLELSKR